MAIVRDYRTQINFKLLNLIFLKSRISHNDKSKSFLCERYVANITAPLYSNNGLTPFFKAKFYCHLLKNLILPDSFFRYSKNTNISNDKIKNLFPFYKEELNIISGGSYHTIDYNNRNYRNNSYYNVIMAMANYPIDYGKIYLFV